MASGGGARRLPAAAQPPQAGHRRALHVGRAPLRARPRCVPPRRGAGCACSARVCCAASGTSAGRVAHLHANVLGWGVLTLLATVVFFGPTILRRQIEPGADERAARRLRHGATGVTVAVLALVATGSAAGRRHGLPPGRRRRHGGARLGRHRDGRADRAHRTARQPERRDAGRSPRACAWLGSRPCGPDVRGGRPGRVAMAGRARRGRAARRPAAGDRRGGDPPRSRSPSGAAASTGTPCVTGRPRHRDRGRSRWRPGWSCWSARRQCGHSGDATVPAAIGRTGWVLVVVAVLSLPLAVLPLLRPGKDPPDRGGCLHHHRSPAGAAPSARRCPALSGLG